LAKDRPNAQPKHEGDAPRLKENRSTLFSLKIKRNVYLVFDTSKGLMLSDMAVATRSRAENRTRGRAGFRNRPP
jgi:hypothetical protein